MVRAGGGGPMWGRASANATDALATSVHGANPQHLVDKIIRTKIYNHPYWKQHCFGLNAESLLERAIQLNCVGGTYGGVQKPTHFIQLILKMLQLQPEMDILIEFIVNHEFKYLRVLAAFYLRLTGKPKDVYQYLEPLYHDFRKVRRIMPDGKYIITHVDQIIDELLRDAHVFDITLPHLPKRGILERSGQLSGSRRSALDGELEENEISNDISSETYDAQISTAGRGTGRDGNGAKFPKYLEQHDQKDRPGHYDDREGTWRGRFRGNPSPERSGRYRAEEGHSSEQWQRRSSPSAERYCSLGRFRDS